MGGPGGFLPSTAGEPALDGFFTSSNGMNTNDEIFDKFFDDSAAMFPAPVEENQSNWPSESISLDNFL